MNTRRFLYLVATVLSLWVVARMVSDSLSLGAAPEGAMEAGRPECPRHDKLFHIGGDSALGWVPGTAEIGTAGTTTLVPEFHDCQRVMVKGESPKKYGPLIAIFASITTSTLPDPPGFLKPLPPPPPPPPSPGSGSGTAAVVTSTVVAPLIPTTLTPPASTSPTPSAVAAPRTGLESALITVLNYDEDYTPLHMNGGVSCIYLYHNSNLWAATIMYAGKAQDSDKHCLEPLDLNKPHWALTVVPVWDPKVVPVTRWERDPVNKESYVGVQCGSSWCEVYGEQIANHQAAPGLSGIGKGWFDQQYLADKGNAPADPDGLSPSLAEGTIVPIGDLAANVLDDFKTWMPVARVGLSADSKKYKDMYKMKQSPPDKGEAIVYLCRGSKSDCNIPLGQKLFMNKCDNSADPWWARIESSEGPSYRCVVQRPPMVPDAPLPPGVVRWRWKLKDEGMWLRCPGGCCEVT